MHLPRVIPLAAALAATAAACTDRDPQDGEQVSAIVGGTVDNGHDYVVGVGGSNSAFCTGTVISKRTVITAGHCIGSVRNIFIGTRTANATKVAVVEQIRHPMYRDLPNDNATWDLGILRLGADAPVQAAPLFRDTMDNTPRFIGPNLVFVGYGITSGNGGGFGTRRVASFPIHVVGPAVVGNSYPAPDNLPAELFYYLDSETGNRNTCNGDSGGPAFFVEGGVEHHIGVTSSGDANCVLDGADQRTDQPYIDDFIQPHIDSFEPGDACRNDGTCDESCNHDGQLGDPDCAAAHCAADGICAEACAAPADPDCVTATPPDAAIDAPPDAAAAPDADPGNGADDGSGGCGCRSATASGAALPLILLALGALARRRAARRSR